MQVPIRIAHSRLSLNRRDHFECFGSTESITQAAITVLRDERTISVRAQAADEDRLSLTPADAIRLDIRPETILSAQRVEFLRLSLRLQCRGKEISYSGQIFLLPRRVMLNDLDRVKLPDTGTVFITADKGRATAWGDVLIGSTTGSSYAEISPEEAASACLKDGDLTMVVHRGVRLEGIPSRLPERFATPHSKGRDGRILISESQVWRAIRERKKIFVPKQAILTPAARELGKSRGVFEFEE